MTLLSSFVHHFDKTVIPVHSYQDYSSQTLQNVHLLDQWLPVLAFFYLLIIFTIYAYQMCRRIYSFDPNIIPIHHIGILCLLMSVIYIGLLFIESHNNQFNILNSCLTSQRIHLISLVIVKYFTTWIFVFNLSYMNQSPFFNPRYKYISKKRRKFLHILFLSFKWLIGIFLPIGIFSAYRRTEYQTFNSVPNDFRYCYMTFNLKNFFVVFGTDILGIILYGLLFGRNACKLTQRKIKNHQFQPDVNPNELATASQYDLDDPIQKSLIVNADTKYLNVDTKDDDNDNDMVYTPAKQTNDTNITDIIDNNEEEEELSHSQSEDETESSDGSTGNNSQNKKSRRRSLSASGTMSRESSVISGAEKNVHLQEKKGMRELVRVLRLIWFMFIFYWINVLLYVFLGLYTSTASIALMVNATCILLLNDYEFSHLYWAIRTEIISICCCFCIIGCGFWCGSRKPSFDDDQYYCFDDDTAYSPYGSKRSSQIKNR